MMMMLIDDSSSSSSNSSSINISSSTFDSRMLSMLKLLMTWASNKSTSLLVWS